VNCGGMSELGVAVVGVGRGEEVTVGGVEVSIDEGSLELRLELPPPWTTNGLTDSMMFVVSVSVWSEATS
jgi:hypothetical protein